MLSTVHRNYLIIELMKGIEAIGLHFETYGYRLADQLAGQKMSHRGANPGGNPVGHILDSVSADGTVAAEYSSQGNYFDDPFKKLINDIDHCIKLGPNVKKLFLVSSRECGPKALTELTKRFADYKKNKDLQVELYDSRRQAEFIVDTVLLNDDATDELAQFVAPLERVRSEYAATRTLPAQSPTYIAQKAMELVVKTKLQADKACIVAGMSGSGKSEITVAVARSLRSSFDVVVWVPASKTASLDELRAVELERRGHRINLQYLLQHRSCLMILDDLQLGTTTQELRKLCGPRSAVLATRQHAIVGDAKIQLLNEADARQLLEFELPAPCPNHIFKEVWRATGGHPFTLRLMNAGVRSSSWDDLAEDCKAIGHYTDAERAQKLTDKLLGRQISQLDRELSLFAWAETSRVDRAFARQTLLPVGLRKLEASCFLAPDRGDVLRLHDIVFAALKSQDLPVERHAPYFDEMMDKYVNTLAFTTGADLQFLTFREVHKPLLVRELTRKGTRSECLFCLSQASREDYSIIELIGDPVQRTKALLAEKKIRDIDASAICEAIEALYRWAKTVKNIDIARVELASRMEAFTLLIDSRYLSTAAMKTVLHHKAKALRNLKDYAAAIEMCEQILNDYDRNSDSEATNLLLARLLASRSKEDALRAKDILFKILENASRDSTSVPLSVTMAAIEVIARKELKTWQREAIDRFGDTVSKLIVEAAARGFDHAFVSFAAFGRDLAYNNQKLFVEVFKKLPRRAPGVVDDDRELSAWVSILASASDIPSLNESGELAAEAEEFFDAIKKHEDFVIQRFSSMLVKLGRNQEAADKLRPLVDTSPTPWLRYWLSKAELALGNQPSALKLINDALAHPDSEMYKATFLEHRAEVRKAEFGAYFEDMRAAEEACKNEKHKKSIADKIAKYQG
ncbi:hypothetical protein [Fimbriiglobus ruber]|nr:hypothetical protein [Fimbriiglobus ruber]